MAVDQARHYPSIVTHGLLLTSTVAVSLLNGTILSPLYDSIAYLLYLVTRGYAFATPALLSHLATVFIAALTLLIAGIPAAVYERIRGLKESTPLSLAIWLAAAVLLSLPTLLKMLGDE